MGLTLYLSLILFSVSCKSSKKLLQFIEAWPRAINLQILCQDCLMSWPGRLRAIFTSVAEAATGGRVAWPSYLPETQLLSSALGYGGETAGYTVLISSSSRSSIHQR